MAQRCVTYEDQDMNPFLLGLYTLQDDFQRELSEDHLG
jgi:hypothetical protein